MAAGSQILWTRSDQFKSHNISAGGFLQVAVSRAPARDYATATGCAAGAPDTALRLLANNNFQLARHPIIRQQAQIRGAWRVGYATEVCRIPASLLSEAGYQDRRSSTGLGNRCKQRALSECCLAERRSEQGQDERARRSVGSRPRRNGSEFSETRPVRLPLLRSQICLAS